MTPLGSGAGGAAAGHSGACLPRARRCSGRIAQACGVPRAPSPDPLRGQPPAPAPPPGAACALPLCTCAVTAPNPGRTPGGPGRCGRTVPCPPGPFPLQTPSLPPSATASSLCPSVFTFPTCRATALFRSAPAFEKRRPFPWTCPLYQWSPLCPFAPRHFVPPPRSLAPRATPPPGWVAARGPLLSSGRLGPVTPSSLPRLTLVAFRRAPPGPAPRL